MFKKPDKDKGGKVILALAAGAVRPPLGLDI